MANYNETPIEQLITRGDNDAFKEIVGKYQGYVYALAFRLLNNRSDAQDVIQESFIRVWNYREKYNKQIKFTTWLYKIVVNLCYDKLKYRKRKAILIDDNVFPEESSGLTGNPEKEMEQKELNKIILNAAEFLSYKQKMVFTLRDLQQLSISEVAEILEISEESVKTNLVYARRAMKEKIEKFYKQDLI